jgi:uncharacterized protein YyaL (SSP411 family)
VALFHPAMQRHGSAFSSLLRAMEEHVTPGTVVILLGDEAAREAWRQALAERPDPRRLVLSIPDDAGDLPPALNRPRQGVVNAWVCRGVSCLPPITELDGLVQACNASPVG